MLFCLLLPAFACFCFGAFVVLYFVALLDLCGIIAKTYIKLYKTWRRLVARGFWRVLEILDSAVLDSRLVRIQARIWIGEVGADSIQNIRF